MARFSIASFSEVLLALGLASGAYAFALSGGDLRYQAYALAFFYASLAVCVASAPGFWRLRRHGLFVFLALAVVMMSNVLWNNGSYPQSEFTATLARALALAGLVFSIQWMVGVLDAQRILRILALAILPLLIIAFGKEIPFSIGTRLAPFDVHPNWWGELLFAFTVAALAFRHAMVRWSLLVLVAVLLYFVQARGAMLACVVAVAVVVMYESGAILRRASIGRLFISVALLGLVLAATIVALSWDTGVFGLVEFFRDRVLLYHDDYRGVGTGVTGRLEVWGEAWDAFLNNPILGQGIDTMSTVHNGFLILASEGGVILLAIVGYLTWNGFTEARRTRNHIALAAIVGYLALVVTYPRFLNLNLAATVFYIALFPWRNPDAIDSAPSSLRQHVADRRREAVGKPPARSPMLER